MTTLKREPIKYIRDFIKKHYKKPDCCYICNSKEKLELHHLYGLSELFNNWCDANKVVIDTEEDIIAARGNFYNDCVDKLSNDHLYTLCSPHHKLLHSIYGQRYANSMVPKVTNWLDIKKDKHGK
jgi:hypothetical protein